MLRIGTMELVVILALALLIFGPKKIPEVAGSIGKGLRALRAAAEGKDDNEEINGDEKLDEE